MNGNGIKFPIILALENDKHELIIYHFKDFKIKSGNYKEYGFKLFEINVNRDELLLSNNYEILSSSINSELSQLDVLFFSNVFDGTYEYSFNGLKNISTNFLIRDDIKRNLENNLISSSGLYREVEQFLFEDINRQIDFVNNFDSFEIIPFKTPNELTISLKKNYLGYFPDDPFDTKKINDTARSIVSGITDLLRASVERNSNFKAKAEYFMSANCFLNYIYEISRSFEYMGSSAIKEFTSFVNRNDNVVNIKDFILKVLHAFEELKLNQVFEKYTAGVIEFCQKIGDFIENDSVITGSGTSFQLNISDKDKFNTFYKLYSNSYIGKPFLNFKWDNLSSGENALLNVFSRFYSLSDKLKKDSNNYLKRNLVILIDEGDIYLHPAWQKEFLYNLLKFIPIIYSNQNNNQNRNIQIILTSNNPISISDLPNSNIIFLGKNKESSIIIDSLEDKKQTFAANIHTLYADSFFLKGGLVGEFAKHKINEVIEILQGSRDAIILKKDDLERIISMIGEPLIKTKLTQMLYERLQLNILDLEKRVKSVEQELSELRKNLRP